jgi:hypothetical protein
MYAIKKCSFTDETQKRLISLALLAFLTRFLMRQKNAAIPYFGCVFTPFLTEKTVR